MKTKAQEPYLDKSVVQPGHLLSEGQCIAFGEGRWPEDYSPILRVCLQHPLSLLPGNIKETPARANIHFLIISEGDDGAHVSQG